MLAVASVLTIANLPYTYFALVPLIKKLKGQEQALIKGITLAPPPASSKPPRLTRLVLRRSRQGRRLGPGEYVYSVLLTIHRSSATC